MMNRLLLLLLFFTLAIRLTASASTTDLVVQSSQSDCGPAALATLLHYLGVQTSEQEMASLSGYDLKRGTSLAGLERAVNAKGGAANSFWMNYRNLRDQLSTFPSPVIVFMMNPEAHFAVLLGVDDDYIYLADPGAGNIFVHREAFLRRWYTSGISHLRLHSPAYQVSDSKAGIVFIAAAPRSGGNDGRHLQIIQMLQRQVGNLKGSRPRISALRP